MWKEKIAMSNNYDYCGVPSMSKYLHVPSHLILTKNYKHFEIYSSDEGIKSQRSYMII
jgi:hypothetical protein